MKAKTELTLNEALTKISAELVGKINKSAYNTYFGSKYADLNQDILPAVTPKLEEYGVSITFTTDFEAIGDRVVEFLVMTVKKGSEEITSRHLLKEDNIQKRGAEITYLRRYLLVSVLNLNTEIDDDGNSVAQPQLQPKGQPAQPQLQPKGQPAPAQQGYTVMQSSNKQSKRNGSSRTGVEAVTEAIKKICKTPEQYKYFNGKLENSIVLPNRIEISQEELKKAWALYYKAIDKSKSKGGINEI
jgi:hypothetical protein